MSEGHSRHLVLYGSMALTTAVLSGMYMYYRSSQKGKDTPGDSKVTVRSLFIYPIKSCKGISVSRATVTPTGFAWDRQWMVVDPKGRFITQRQEPKMAHIVPSLPPKILFGDGDPSPKNAFMTLTALGSDKEPLCVPLDLASYEESTHASVWEWSGSALDAGPSAAAWLTSVLGRECRLVRFDLKKAQRKTDPDFAAGFNTAFADGFPYLLASQKSLSILNTRLSQPLPINRFRPNILVGGCEAFAEDRWQEFTIGDDRWRMFKGVKPCGRCKITTTDQESLEVGEEPLKTLKEFRGGERFDVTPAMKKDVFFGINIVASAHWPRVVGGVVTIGDQVTVLREGAKEIEMVEEGNETRESSVGDKVGSGDGVAKE